MKDIIHKIFLFQYKLNNLVSGNLKAVWEFKSTGIKSEIGVYPFSSLFIIQEKGCCGGGDVNKNYSLNTGQLIAYSSKDILFVDLSSISEKRYIGVEDNVVPSQSLEGDHVAVIFYSNADYIIQQYLVTHPNDNEEWVLDRFEITENKIGTNPNNLTPKSKSAEYNLFISLWCRCEDPVVEFTIPILEEKLDINSASINGDSRVRIETINHKNSLQANVPSGP